MSLDTLLSAAAGGGIDGGQHDGGDDDLKFVFVGGKGGVGKTTTSGAMATLFATIHPRKRVLLISTDPAHSLGDAFRSTFTNEPTCPSSTTSDGGGNGDGGELSNLHVMEVDPREAMEAELARWAELAGEVSGGGDASSDGDEGGDGELLAKIRGLQEWLSSVPGIDEATALSGAVRHVESGMYDLVIFDTAPTGHTLKLLAMPDVLKTGLDRLRSWQGTMWGLWETLRGFGGGGSSRVRTMNSARAEVARRLEEYRRGIEKISDMIRDRRRTRFVVVCIAEYLSISETRRLLVELRRNRVRASHVVVNQLVVGRSSLTKAELDQLEELAEVGRLRLNGGLLEKTVHACRLTTARRGIQERYLEELKSCDETRELSRDGGICEVPLLPEEIAGTDALLRFGRLMVTSEAVEAATSSQSSSSSEAVNRGDMERSLPGEGQGGVAKRMAGSVDASSGGGDWVPRRGDVVTLGGLVKSHQYNGLEGTVVSDLDPETGRYGVEVEYQSKAKTLALRRENLSPATSKAKRRKLEDGEEEGGANNAAEGKDDDRGASGTAAAAAQEQSLPVSDETVSKAKELLQDPEIRTLIASNPRFAAAVEDVMKNPMSFIKYLADPEMSPLITKAMAKLKGGC